jgi:glycosyltransferase involved in cell wall biosynthesis
MKILHAYLFYSIKFAGGTSDLMHKIMKAQIKAGHNPKILTGNYNIDASLLNEIGIDNVIVMKSFFDKFGLSIMPILPIWCFLNIKKYDVVHLHVYRTYQNFVLYIFCKIYNVPYVIDAHGSVPLYMRKNKIKKLFDLIIGKKIMHGASALIAETEVGVKEYLDLDPSLSSKRILVLSPPFDTDEYLKLPVRGKFRSKWGISESKKVIMFLGRIHHIKGNDFLIRGFSRFISKYNEDAELILIGPDDGHMDYCKQLVLDLNISKYVLFTGFMGGGEKNSALVDADIVVQLSRQEQGAWAPFEAVLCGTPIVVTSHTGTAEDVRKINAGYLVDFDDDEQLAATFKHILDNYDAAKEKTSLAKLYIENNLSMNVRVNEYIDIYEKSAHENY